MTHADLRRAGPGAEHVITPQIDAFNKVANGEMVIELYNADQRVPHSELLRALTKGAIDAMQSDDDSIAAPVDVSVLAAYFPFASRTSRDVPVLWNQYGPNEIWGEAYRKVEDATWLSKGAWVPCSCATAKPTCSLGGVSGRISDGGRGRDWRTPFRG